MSKPSLQHIIIYAKDVQKTVAFYEKHFNFNVHTEEGDRIVELIPVYGGSSLMIHPAGKGVKQGQATVKLVFDVEDIEQFKDHCAKNGLIFGAVHKANGYRYSNAKDPNKNSIQISSRAFRK